MLGFAFGAAAMTRPSVDSPVAEEIMMFTPILTKLAALAFAGLMALSAACVSANQGDSEVATASDRAGDGDDDGERDIVCRTERPTGSNIAQRVCYDRNEVEDRSERDQQGLRDTGRFGCEGPGCAGESDF
jgi:hypothetical protein